MNALFGAAALFALVLLRQPLLLILAAGTAFVHVVLANSKFDYMIQDVWTALDKEILLAIPMFLLAGAVMTRGSIAKRLIRIMIALTAPIPGGISVATVLSCAIFAAISGSSIVTMLAVGTVMFPALISNGYPRSFSIGLICASGTLGIIIPPSIPMIPFGIMTETSITKLFLAGIVPGLLLAFLLAGYSVLVNRHRDRSNWDKDEILASIRSGFFALALPVLLLGGIYSGYFTPTEAAAAALVYSLIVEGLIHREIGFRDFYEIVGSTASLMGMLLPLVAFATSLSVIMDYERVPQAIVAWVQTFIDSRTTFLIAANAILLLAGCVMDVGSAIVILAPLLMPLALVYGVDPVHFGIVMTVNLEIGYITPPVGLNLFVAIAAFKASFSEVCRSVLPFIVILLFGLLLITAVPALSLWVIS
ncbi:MAG: TRAP transporter large permease [Rhodoferax sp.]|nr:TRAP transporter large permease [Rhodoferax sp.]